MNASPVRPHFEDPPLVEAVFDLFVQSPSREPAPKFADLERGFFQNFEDYNSHREEWWQKETQVQLTPSSQDGSTFVQAVRTLQGVRKWNEEKREGVLFGPDVLAFNVLAPYRSFADYGPRLRALLEAYETSVKPSGLVVLGHRYVNQVRVDVGEGLAPSELFSLYPKLEPAFARKHPPVQVQVEMGRFANGVVSATLALAVSDPNAAVYSLDLYARTVELIPLNVPDALEWHQRAHEQIFHTFLASITDVARKRFKEKP